MSLTRANISGSDIGPEVSDFFVTPGLIDFHTLASIASNHRIAKSSHFATIDASALGPG
jgi:imidazolonepropionase-like amidohydrolase